MIIKSFVTAYCFRGAETSSSYWNQQLHNCSI